jgi:hypothetical protein
MWDGMGRDGMGWDGMGWDGMGWDGMGWDGMGSFSSTPHAHLVVHVIVKAADVVGSLHARDEGVLEVQHVHRREDAAELGEVDLALRGGVGRKLTG